MSTPIASPAPAQAAADLTIADLVVLALVAERPMHGYQVLAELEERDFQDWAPISRPQVYYSLKKLARMRLVSARVDPGQPRGPRRQVLGPTTRGRHALADALERDTWVTQRPPPAFVTWLVLSVHARPDSFDRVVARRRAFLREQIDRERVTTAELEADGGRVVPVAKAIVSLAIRQFELELAWLDEVAASLRPA